MKSEILAQCHNPHLRGELKKFKIEYPSICPICGTAIEASAVHSTYISESTSSGPNLFSVFFCSHCETCFLGYYRQSRDIYSSETKLVGFFPRDRYKEKEFSDIINELSPDFCRIYQQAYEAEQSGHDELSGIGYRKALEFLIKDYAISQNTDEIDKISRMPLSGCINEYIDNRRIRKLALASAWIGNDETHYVRKHQEYSVDDLKLFINAAATFIESDISSMKAEKLIDGD